MLFKYKMVEVVVAHPLNSKHCLSHNWRYKCRSGNFKEEYCTKCGELAHTFFKSVPKQV